VPKINCGMYEVMSAIFRKRLILLGWSHAELARRFGKSDVIAGQWAADLRQIPPAIDDYVTKAAAAIEAIPVPVVDEIGELTEKGKAWKAEQNQKARMKPSK
jgi:hypothetical protein